MPSHYQLSCYRTAVANDEIFHFPTTFSLKLIANCEVRAVRVRVRGGEEVSIRTFV